MTKDLNSVFVRCNNLSLRKYIQGTAVLAFDIGQAFQVDEIGAKILCVLEAPKRISELIDLLSNEYNASPELIAGDIQDFLDNCSELGVIEEIPNDA